METKSFIVTYQGIKHEVLFDSEDYEKISKFNWHIKHNGVQGRTKGKRPWAYVKISRLVMNVTDPDRVVDHINHNIYDNRKINLRICSVAENNQNRRKQIRNQLDYKGIYETETGTYNAMIGFERKIIYIGNFKTQKEAALAYDSAARHFFKDFACLNFPNEFDHPYEYYTNRLVERNQLRQLSSLKNKQLYDSILDLSTQVERFTVKDIFTILIAKNHYDKIGNNERATINQTLTKLIKLGELTRIKSTDSDNHWIYSAANKITD